jgi:site-specific DNA-methyltransferase (adenine-specific)
VDVSDYRLECGDCLDVLPTLEAGSVDLICADLPYQVTQNPWDSMIPLEPLWREYRRVLKQRGAVVLTASQPFTSILVLSNRAWFRHEWIWLKNCGSNFANTVREPMKEHESVLVFSPGGWTYNKQMQERTGAGAGRAKYAFNALTHTPNYGKFNAPRQWQGMMRVPSSWQKFNRETGLHPNQKPIALGEYLIRTYSNEGDLVLDNACGSASFGVAALNTGRRFIGIERDAGYYAIAERRMEQAATAARQERLEIA